MRASILLPAALLAAACGASTPPPAPTAGETSAPAARGDGSAAEQCLATANARRARSAGEPAKIGVRHVLVKYRGSKNPAAGVTRTREEACLRAVEVRDKLRQGADWDAMVKEYSDETGAATRGGTVGTVDRSEVARAFGDAAFELSRNMLSDVVETEFGFHVIFRNE